MKTIDIHTHLLNPQVKFDRLYDKVTLHFFAKSLGVDPAKSNSTNKCLMPKNVVVKTITTTKL